MITFCDSCTEEKEVTEIKHRGETFYWCDECKEEE
jgi:formamidopyrimidine-DNA glycosylase